MQDIGNNSYLHLFKMPLVKLNFTKQ